MKFLLTLILCWNIHPETNTFKIYKNGVFSHDVTGNRTTTELYNDDTISFTVTAVKDGIESIPSAPLTFHAPRLKMIAHGEFTFTQPKAKANQRFIVESSTDLKTWVEETDVFQMVHSDDGVIETIFVRHNSPSPHMFYRIRIDMIREGCAA
jgi:hypothetical protein